MLCLSFFTVIFDDDDDDDDDDDGVRWSLAVWLGFRCSMWEIRSLRLAMYICLIRMFDVYAFCVGGGCVRGVREYRYM
jgi:hypothetical protein